MKSFYDISFKTLTKEIGEDTRRWKDVPCSWIGGITIAKLAVLTKSMYKFKEIPIKISTQSFTDFEKIIFSFMWKHKRPRIAKTVNKCCRYHHPQR